MNLWIDAQISPALAPWIERNFPGWTARSLKFLGLRDSPDLDVFWAAREHGAVILSKDHWCPVQLGNQDRNSL